MPNVTQLDDGLYLIDLEFQGQPGVIASYLIEDDGERALIEIGPTSTLDTLLSALQTMGIEPDSISKVLVTHVHLDHAGASGTFMRRFPRPQLFVHEMGAPHMIDPSRLVKSATRIYGNMMDTLWGAIESVPEDRTSILVDGDTVTVGKKQLAALYTPGHASHHVALHDPERDAVFTGDVGAVRLQDIRYVRPATPPPDIDLELWSESLERIKSLHPRVLYVTHFGPSTDVTWHLQEARDHLYEWGAIVQRAMHDGKDRDEIVELVRRHGDGELLQLTNDPSVVVRYELSTPYGMSVEGYLRYYKKRAPAASVQNFP